MNKFTFFMQRFGFFYCLRSKYKIMKQVCSCLVCLILIIQAKVTNAQSSKNNTGSWRYTASIELMTPPISTLHQTNKAGYGSNLETEYFLNQEIAASMIIGFDYFPGSNYSYSQPDINIHPRITKVKDKGIPFLIIPIMVGMHYYPEKWFYISGSAGLALGGSGGEFKATVGYEPEIGFLIPIKKSFINIGLKFLYSNLNTNATKFVIGGDILETDYDFAQAIGISLGWKF